MQIEVCIKGRRFNYCNFTYQMIGVKTRPAFGDFLFLLNFTPFQTLFSHIKRTTKGKNIQSHSAMTEKTKQYWSRKNILNPNLAKAPNFVSTNKLGRLPFMIYAHS